MPKASACMRGCVARPINVASPNNCAAPSRGLPHLPTAANGRLSRDRKGDVVLRLKSPYQDGTTHIVMSPLEFMRKRLPCDRCASNHLRHRVGRELEPAALGAESGSVVNAGGAVG